MSLEVESEEETLEFDHMKKPAGEGQRKCACTCIGVNPYALTLHAAHSLTHPDMYTLPSEI